MVEKDNNSFKVVMLGDAGVGKTCIVQRYITGAFSDQTESTLGSNFFKKTISVKDKKTNQPANITL